MSAQLFPVLFDMSLGASFVIAAVLLLRLLGHRFPRRYFLILWAVVLLRLLCPILPESELSVIPPETLSFAKETALPERSEVTVLSAADAAVRAVGDTLNGGIDTVYVKLDREPYGREPSDQSAIPAVTAYHDQIWLLFLEKLWLGGASVLVLRQIILDIRLRRRLKTAIPYPADLPAGLLPHRIRVYLADNIPTAFVLGILRPTIYLPSDISVDAAVYVLAHESVHVRRLDPLWKLLSAAALCLHWFNPLVWAAYFCASADLEYACDEAAPKLLSKVLPEADDNMTASYAQALLNVSTGKARLGMLALGWGNVPRRIRRLLCDTPKRVFCIMLFVICIVVCLFCIGNPPAQFDTDDVRMCTLDDLDIPTEHGKTLVDAINNASRSVNRTYDAIGQNPLDHTAVINFADGSYLEVNYLYTSGYSFNPAHPGEDDYKTVLWHRDALGKTVGTWVMEYDFDAVFRDWMIASEKTPDNGDVLVHAPSDSEIGIAVVMLDDRQSMDVPLLPVAYDKPVDYDRVPEITVHDGAVIAISGIGTKTLSVSEDYYEARFSDSTFIDRQTMKLTADEDGIYRFPVTHRHPGKAEHAVYYIGADACRYVFRIRFIGEE